MFFNVKTTVRQKASISSSSKKKKAKKLIRIPLIKKRKETHEVFYFRNILKGRRGGKKRENLLRVNSRLYGADMKRT